MPEVTRMRNIGGIGFMLLAWVPVGHASLNTGRALSTVGDCLQPVDCGACRLGKY
ncbi:exported hypothetical protein [Serratia proteamaculans]|nr:exported hypothetical protein [Serratia proteamaculans]